MDIFVAIVSLLGGLAMFLYGIEVMGDGLKNSSGTTLKRILEKVTGNVLIGVLTGTLVTAVIQSSEFEASCIYSDGCQYRYDHYRADCSPDGYRIR